MGSCSEKVIFECLAFWGLEPLGRDTLATAKADATTSQKLTQPLRKGCRRHLPPHATKQTNGGDDRIKQNKDRIRSVNVSSMTE